jgi:PAS domain S-box-containing protein
VTEQSDVDIVESAAALRAGFDSAATGMVVASPRGLVLRTNAAFRRIAGHSGDELQGMPLADLIHPDDRDAMRAARAVASGTAEPTHFEGRLATRDGGWAVTQWILSVARDEEDGAGSLHAAVEHPSPRRRDDLDKRLQESLRLAPAAVVMLKGPDHAIEFANEELFAALGRRECIGVPVREAFPEVATQAYVDQLDLVLETGESHTTAEAPVMLDRRGDGMLEEAFFTFTYQPVHDGDGHVGGIFGHGVDVTETVKVRRQLEAMAGRLAQQFAHEHLVAETLQRSLLPKELPRLPGVDVAARFVAGSSEAVVGGDWYDALALPDGRLMLMIGDVEGRGLEAAATMGQARNALRAYALEGAPPAEVLCSLDRLMAATGEERFVTALCAVLDADLGELVYANAGHVPPLLARADGTTTFLDGGLTAPVGVPVGVQVGGEAAERFVEARVTIDPGATLLLYTDGLVERRTEGIDDGLARLAGALAPGAELDELLDRLVALCTDDDRDDVAILAVRMLPAG